MSELGPSSYDSPAHHQLYPDGTLTQDFDAMHAIDMGDDDDYPSNPNAYGDDDLMEQAEADAAVQSQLVQETQSTTPESTLKVKYTTFEEARQAEKKFSDGFIDSALQEQDGSYLTFDVGTEKVGLKGYLDKIEASPADEAIINDPEAIAAVYLNTTEMVARNLKIKVAKGTNPERVQEIAAAKSEYLAGLKAEALKTADEIVDWVVADDRSVAPIPSKAYGYYGFKVEKGGQTVDALDKDGIRKLDFHPNIAVQRQGGGNFIFGYTDARISQRMDGRREELSERIYLNPEITAAPEVFEKVLSVANQAGIPLEVKMLQRSEELGAAHIEKSRNPSNGDALRGDGVVIYTSGESANDVLALALAIAQDQPEAFAGRKTSRIPQTVAEGVAIGSEPNQRPGEDAESLTSSRDRIISTVARKVVAAGKSGQEARDAFRRGMVFYAEREGIDPKNIAFNAEAA